MGSRTWQASIHTKKPEIYSELMEEGDVLQSPAGITNRIPIYISDLRWFINLKGMKGAVKSADNRNEMWHNRIKSRAGCLSAVRVPFGKGAARNQGDRSAAALPQVQASGSREYFLRALDGQC